MGTYRSNLFSLCKFLGKSNLTENIEDMRLNFEKSEDKFQIAYIRENGEKPGISKFVKFVKNYKITPAMFKR